MKKHIPNLITLLNLLSGIIAMVLAVENHLVEAGFFMILGIFFDFFDGFLARLLKVQGELGKQLDSLADMVTSGLVPAVVMFQLLRNSLGNWNGDYLIPRMFFEEGYSYVPFFGFLIALASAYRLANFNIDKKQSSSFIGIPTPANALFILSLPLILNYSTNDFAIYLIQNTSFLLVITVAGSIMMNANILLFSLKFTEYSFRNNAVKYVFIVASISLLIGLHFVAFPLIILLYILTSVVENMFLKK